jgi:hypothetical protein
MLDRVWDVLRDPDNRAVLGWIAGGIFGGGWVVFKFFISKKPTVSASNGGVAAGRDIRDNNINTDSRTKR